MSQISDMLGSALSTLNAATGQSLAYRTGVSGTWTALPDAAFLEQSDPQVIDYDENRRAVMAPAKATVRIVVGGPRLVAATVAKGGSQVRHTLGANVTQYGVVGGSPGDGVMVYELEREVAQSVGDPRGGVPR